MSCLQSSINLTFRLAGCCAVWLAFFAATAHAEIVTLDVTVRSVDTRERSITVTRSSKNKSKELDLEVSKKAKILIDGEEARLKDLRPGQSATISFESELEIVTRIEVAAEGDDSTPAEGDGPTPEEGDDSAPEEMPDESGELSDTGCQVTWTIDENGASTVTIGRPPASRERARQPLIRHDDGTVEFLHDLNTPDAVTRTLMSRAENTRFDRTLQALVLAPKAGRGGQSPQANFAYARLARLPIMMSFQFEGVGDGNRCLLSVQLRSADDESDFPAIKLLSDDGFATTATVQPTWIVRRDRRGEPNSEPLLEKELVELGEPRQFPFQMPALNDSTSYVLEFELQSQDSPIALRRLAVRGRLTPTLGVALTQAGGAVVAEKVFARGLGEAAGVRAGDIIMSINGIKARSVQDAMDAMGGIQFGDEAEIVVRRAGRMIPIRFLAE